MVRAQQPRPRPPRPSPFPFYLPPSSRHSLACSAHALHVCYMSKMIQIRDVPDRLHKVLTAKAATAGMSLSDYIKKELEKSAARWTWEEVEEHLQSLPPILFSEDPVEILRKSREQR